MREIHIPYCRETLPLHVEEKNLSAVLTARMHEYDPGQPEAAIVQEALEHPIGTPRLRELAKAKRRSFWSHRITPAPFPASSPCRCCWPRYGPDSRTPTLPF